MILFRKLVYHVISFAFIITNLIFSLPYSSEFLDNNSKKDIKTYYSKNLYNLTRALKPRIIHYITSENYLEYHKIRVTGVLFTYQDREAKNVIFTSSRDNFKRHQMTRNTKGVWYHLLSPKPYKLKKPQRKVRYRFLVDGAFENDANGDIETHSDGSQVSVYYFDQLDFEQDYGTLITKQGASHQSEIIFRVKIPGAHKVSLIGSFNHWNQELDTMKEVSKDVFEIRKELPQGKYIYLYRASGEYHVDTINTQKRRHPVYGRVSYFEIK